MTKAELVSNIASSVNCTKADATKALEAMLDSIQNSLKNGNDVRLTGFGTFKVANRAARVARNPRTGQSINVPASKAPVFRAGKELKEAVNR